MGAGFALAFVGAYFFLLFEVLYFFSIFNILEAERDSSYLPTNFPEELNISTVGSVVILYWFL